LTLRPGTQIKPRKRLLDPLERIIEVLFGLIMVLTVTCSFGIAEGHRIQVHELLLAALGCNLAWGAIDAVFYLMTRFSEKGQGILALRGLHSSTDPSEAHGIIADALPPFLASALSPIEFEAIRQRLNQIGQVPQRPQLVKEDWVAALGVFLFVFLSTFPVVIPFILISEPRLALRTSTAIAVAMLFVTGYALGRYAGRRPLLSGIVMAILGSALAGFAIAVGG
jgi:VIT family